MLHILSRMRHFVSLSLCLLIAVWKTSALSCAPCDQFECPPVTIETCEYGTRSTHCGCCTACQNGPGDLCGGPWRAFGGCGEGLYCRITRRTFPRSHSVGVCDVTPESSAE